MLLDGAVVVFGCRLARDAWQLLLRLADGDAAGQSRLVLLSHAGSWPGARESNLLVLLLTVLDVQLRFACLDGVAFLADALVRDVRALILFLLSAPIAYLQMPINERRRELVFGNGRC